MTERKSLCTEELRDLVRETVHETLLSLGVQTDDPIEVQRDMQFVRDMRRAAKSAKTKAFLTGAGLVVTGLAYVVWEGVKGWFKGIGTP